MREEEKEMSPLVKHFTHQYLTRIACWGQGCLCRRRKVGHGRTKFDASEAVHNGIFLEKNNNAEGVIHQERKSIKTIKVHIKTNHAECDMTWRELSEIVDKVFYNLYMFLICTSTTILFLVIIVGYTTV